MNKLKKIKCLVASFACVTLAGSTPAAEKPLPVALLATGTNGGTDVERDTERLITRLQNAGYRVVVIPPRNAPASATSDNRNLIPRHAAVMAAATARHAEILMPKTWLPDGFHIAHAESAAIGRMYKGAPTFGDSNSVFINRGSGGHCIGVSGMQTHEMLLTQFPPAPASTGAPRPCRELRDLQKVLRPVKTP